MDLSIKSHVNLSVISSYVLIFYCQYFSNWFKLVNSLKYRIKLSRRQFQKYLQKKKKKKYKKCRKKSLHCYTVTLFIVSTFNTHPQQIFLPAHPKQPTLIVSTNGTIFAFFGVSLVLVHCFDCSFVSGVKRCTHISPIVMNRRKIQLYCDRNILALPFLFNCEHTSISSIAYSCPNFRPICGIQYFLKCLSFPPDHAHSRSSKIILWIV